MITAIVLAGGLGTRLAPVIPHLPKALAPIQGVPFLQLLLRQLEKSSIISKIVLALGHKAESIQQFLAHTSLPIHYSIEPSPLGTGGALLHALPQADGSTLLVLNGDSFFDLSIPHFLDFHLSHAADLSIACREVEDTSRYGSVEWDSTLHIRGFREKSSLSQPGWINAGLYLIQKDLLKPFSPGVYSLEKDLFPQFLKKKALAYPNVGSFIDIGTPNSYNEAQQILNPWIIK